MTNLDGPVEFARQQSLFAPPKPQTPRGQMLLADSGVSDQPVNRPKPESAMPTEATGPKQVKPLAGQQSFFKHHSNEFD